MTARKSLAFLSSSPHQAKRYERFLSAATVRVHPSNRAVSRNPRRIDALYRASISRRHSPLFLVQRTPENRKGSAGRSLLILYRPGLCMRHRESPSLDVARTNGTRGHAAEKLGSVE